MKLARYKCLGYRYMKMSMQDPKHSLLAWLPNINYTQLYICPSICTSTCNYVFLLFFFFFLNIYFSYHFSSVYNAAAPTINFYLYPCYARCFFLPIKCQKTVELRWLVEVPVQLIIKRRHCLRGNIEDSMRCDSLNYGE